MPSLVREVGVRGDRIDLDAHLLEFGVVVGQVLKLGRADEGEVGRIEKEDSPFSGHVGVGDGGELAVLEGFGLERLHFGIDERHIGSVGWCCWVHPLDSQMRMTIKMNLLIKLNRKIRLI